MQPEILAFLKANCKSKVYHPGEIIFSQGDIAGEFYYLESGLSLTYTILENGRERNILISWPDRLFGVSTVFEHVPRRASAIALKRCSVLVITQDIYEECCRLFEDFQRYIIVELSRDIGVLFEELVDSSLLSANIKVARFICRRMVNGQCTTSGDSIVLKYTQELIASVLGISRLSVNQALSSFAANGWLSTSYGKITVIQPAALREYAYSGSEQ